MIVRESIKKGIEINCLPGPTALIPALVNSGLSSERFVFEGFLPSKKGRSKRLKNIQEETRSIVLYESPKRLLRLLRELKEILGENRRISISREISKVFQENLRGTIAEIISRLDDKIIKGEIVVIIDGK